MADRISGAYPHDWIVNLQQTSSDFTYFAQQGGWADLYYTNLAITAALISVTAKLRQGL